MAARALAALTTGLLLGSCASGAGPVPAGCPAEGCGLPEVGTLDGEGREWVEETLASLSTRQRIGQLVIQWLPGNYASPSSEEFAEWAGWVADDEIGGIYLSIGLPHSYAAKVNELQSRATVPLLVTSDFENGGPGMRINHSYALPSMLPQGGGTSFPPTMAFGAIGDPWYAKEYGRITGIEARAVGVNLNFAPVLDVNSNPDNPIINTRSFGEDPEAVATLGAAYMEGAREAGMLTTAKHFPGHGDTETDSHVDLPIIPADWDRLEAVELVPFQRAVDEGVDAVMTAHIVASGIGGLDAPPATFDPVFMTELLRDRMGFDGLLFTDALVMGAIADRYGAAETAIGALEAGADVLLMPTDVTEAIDAVEEAVRSGRIPMERVDRSVRRILEAKARAGLHRNRWVDLDLVDDRVGTGAHQAFADSAASRSMTLLRDERTLLPLVPARAQRVLSITYARADNLVASRAFDPEIARVTPEFRRARIGPETTEAAYDSLLIRVAEADVVLLNAYVPPRAGVGDVAVPEALSAFVSEVADAVPLVVTSFGNPYLLAALPEAPTYLIAWGDREVSQRAAARALYGHDAITGSLPISIPPEFRIGDGIRRPAFGPTSAVPPPPSAIGAPAAASTGLADPAALGMDARALEAVDRVILDAIADSATPGAVVAVGRGDRLVKLSAYGRLDWAEDAPPATTSSIYDLASLTKVVGTTSAVMSLVEEGALDLDAPVVSYLTWWSAGDPRKEAVTVRQLLLHRGGLPPFRRWYTEIEGRHAYREAIADVPLEYEPGTRTVYSDIGFMTLGLVVEAVTERPLDSVLSRRVWGPLGMTDTAFNPSGDVLQRVAPTEVDTILRHTHVHGVVHDENAFAMGGVVGHAGLFSTAGDLAAFAGMMLSGGRDGLFGLETVAHFTARYDDSASRALGWDTPSGRSSAGDYFSARSFGHTGFTGTSIWMDPELDVFVVLLTNRVNPTRDNDRHVPVRRAVHDAVAQSITDRTLVPREPR